MLQRKLNKVINRQQQQMGCTQNKQKQQEDPMPLINMLIVGLTGSGKSTILSQLKGQPQATCNEELGINSFIINKKLKIIAFEVPGRAYNSWHNYYITSNIVLFVIDSTQPENFSKIQSILSDMDGQLDPKAKIILVFNKIDHFIIKPSQALNQQTSHVTEYLDTKSIKIKEIDNFNFHTLIHEVYKCKCSGKDRIGLNSLLKRIYSLSLSQIYRNQQTSQTQKQKA